MGSRLKKIHLSGLAVPWFVFLLLGIFNSSRAYAADPVNKDSAGVALKGYDAVAYFNESTAIAGKKEFQHEWMGAKWQFSSAANRDLFAANPSKYAPQYGGYCAFGVSEGHKAPVDPAVWKIVDGKLYLNYNAEVGKIWGQNIPDRIARANKNWLNITKQ
jgi:YHS domain-containing protein